jgi:hypothetical protein
MLPTYQRFNASSSGKIRSFRASERILILLVFISFLIIVLFGFFLLPDFAGSAQVLQVYNKIKKAGPEIFIPAPPIEKNRDTYDFDRIKFQNKINSQYNSDGLEKPDVQQPPQKVPVAPLPVPNPKVHQQPSESKKNPSTDANEVYNVDGADRDPAVRKKRDKVKEVSQNNKRK